MAQTTRGVHNGFIDAVKGSEFHAVNSPAAACSNFRLATTASSADAASASAGIAPANNWPRVRCVITFLRGTMVKTAFGLEHQSAAAAAAIALRLRSRITAAAFGEQLHGRNRLDPISGLARRLSDGSSTCFSRDYRCCVFYGLRLRGHHCYNLNVCNLFAVRDGVELSCYRWGVDLGRRCHRYLGRRYTRLKCV